METHRQCIGHEGRVGRNARSAPILNEPLHVLAGQVNELKAREIHATMQVPAHVQTGKILQMLKFLIIKVCLTYLRNIVSLML